MKIKDLDTILDEYAVNSGYPDWCDMFYSEAVEIGTKGIEEIANAYASQFQAQNELLRERAKELEEHMKEFASVLSWVLDNARPDTDWETFTNSVTNAMVEANSLINKGK